MVLFPYEPVEKIDIESLKEPSGIVFQAERGTLFLVGDEGDIGEFRLNGQPLQLAHLGDRDLEGITTDPASGLLYVVSEARAEILEVHPDTLAPLRLFTLNPTFEGLTILSAQKNKVEGLTFAPEQDHPEGGVFYLINQNPASSEATSSFVFAVEVPLRSGGAAPPVANIVSAVNLPLPDLADLHYDPRHDQLYLISDQANVFVTLSRTGQVGPTFALPGDNQEGLTFDSTGLLYLAQDSGGVLKFKPRPVATKQP
jgi:hypothetical protein